VALFLRINSFDPRGAGETHKPEGTYSVELFADDVAAFMKTIGVERAHVSGLSFGGCDGTMASLGLQLVVADDPEARRC
jgi:pimeloyl-ACP methyl ester carboxylesterase